MTFFTRVMSVLIACEVFIVPGLLCAFIKDVDPESKALAIYVPLTATLCGNCSPFDIVPSSDDSKALAIWVPLTPSVYGDRSPFGDDLVPSTALSFLSRLVQFIMGLNNMAASSWYDLLVDVGSILGEEVVGYLFIQFVILLWYTLVAATKYMSKMLNWFHNELIPLLATVQQFFNGRPNALKFINTTSTYVADKSYAEQHPPSAESRPKAPFEAGPPEPRSEPKSLELPQTHSEITSNDDLIQHGSTAMNQMPELIDEQPLTEPPVGDIPCAEQNTQPLEPMTNMEKEIYKWHLDELTETLTTIATFPVDDQQLPTGFANAVKFVRDSKSIIKLQTEGLAYVREMVGLVNQGIKDLTARADFQVSKELSQLGSALEKLEATFVERCDIKLLTKNIEYIDQIHMEGAFEKRGVWFKCGPMVNRTKNHITTFLEKRQEYTEDFLREVRGLSDTYNINREWIMFMTAPRDSFF